MKLKAEVEVLGVTYKIFIEVTELDNPRIKGLDGYCDCANELGHNMYIANFSGERKAYEAEVIRHELVHAFLYESGLDTQSTWARDEEVVDWIAIQFPKMSKAFKSIS